METVKVINKNFQFNIYKDIAKKFVISLLIGNGLALFIWWEMWPRHKDFIHMLLEIVSICVGMAIFLVVWNSQASEDNINHLIGFGFLNVAIFDFMHTYYYEGIVYNEVFSRELSFRYWILARLIQTVILLIFSFSPYLKTINKYLALIINAIIVGCFFYILYNHSEWIPILYDEQGVTKTKIQLEYFVMLIAVISLFILTKNLHQENLIKFKYLYLSVLMILPSEFCFTIFRDSGSFSVVLGHVLKIFSYCYLYKAVFQSLINYPYKKINESRERLADILNAIPIPIQTYHTENKIDFVNQKFEQLFTCPKEKVIGLNEEEVLQVLKKIGSPVKKFNSVVTSYLNCHQEEIKVLVSNHEIKGGKLTLFQDVKQEQEIENLNLQAQTILNAITTPMVILDDQGILTAYNQALLDLVEIDDRNIIGLSATSLKKILNISEYTQKEACSLDIFNNSLSNWMIKTPKGTCKHIQVNTSIIYNLYNDKIGTVSVIQNISQIREQQLKLINQEKLALLGQMGATIVHETRNFLTTIKGNSQLIELFTKDEKLKQYAKKINHSTNEVNRIISDFLNLSKPRHTVLEEVAFNDLILSMKSTLETSSMMNHVQLIVNLYYDERYILCDEVQMKQVILNICKNGVEAMSQSSEPILQISTGLNEMTKEVFIKISDNGVGIDSEAIPKVGTPFFTTKKFGTGLGLSACYNIIKEHNGNIAIESELGKGTTFIITLPYLDEAIDDLEDII